MVHRTLCDIGLLADNSIIGARAVCFVAFDTARTLTSSPPPPDRWSCGRLQAVAQISRGMTGAGQYFSCHTTAVNYSRKCSKSQFCTCLELVASHVWAVIIHSSESRRRSRPSHEKINQASDDVCIRRFFHASQPKSKQNAMSLATQRCGSGCRQAP